MKIYRKEELGKADYGWLKPRYHFSFASYQNSQKINIGSLRVLNDDLISPNSGFDTHPHNNMEIITYIIDGELVHKDSMNNERILKRGNIQYMSAGTGVFHSEFNKGSEALRVMQIWIIPNQKDVAPNYGDKLYTLEDRLNTQFNIVSGFDRTGDIKIHQDANIYIGEYNKDGIIDINIEDFDYIYFVQIEGKSTVEENELNYGDAFSTDKSIKLTVKKGSHFLYLKLKNIERV